MSDDSELSQVNLPGVGILSGMDKDSRAILATYGNFSFLKAGKVLIEQGQPQNRLFLVLSGELHAKRADENHIEMLLGTIRTGESLGEVTVFDPGTASATVTAVTDVQIWSIERDELSQFLENDPVASVQLLGRVAEVLSKRLRGLANQLSQKAYYQALLGEIINK